MTRFLDLCASIGRPVVYAVLAVLAAAAFFGLSYLTFTEDGWVGLAFYWAMLFGLALYAYSERTP